MKLFETLNKTLNIFPPLKKNQILSLQAQGPIPEDPKTKNNKIQAGTLKKSTITTTTKAIFKAAPFQYSHLKFTLPKTDLCTANIKTSCPSGCG